MWCTQSCTAQLYAPLQSDPAQHKRHQTTPYFFLRMRLRPTAGQPGSSSIISRVKLRQTIVQLRKRAGFDDVGHRLGLITDQSKIKTKKLELKFTKKIISEVK